MAAKAVWLRGSMAANKISNIFNHGSVAAWLQMKKVFIGFRKLEIAEEIIVSLLIL